MLRNCNHCQQPYNAKLSELNRGCGRFCSRMCARHHRPLKERTPNACCGYCEQPFYCKPSRQQQSQTGLLFCSRKHKDLAQRIGSGVPIQPSHYKEGAYIKYRILALNTYGKACQDCGWDSIAEVLEVHHLDGDRTNNTVTNLRVVCPTCHTIRHRNIAPQW